jgi:hypothetical protein
MKTTLNEIRKHHPSNASWEKLLRHLNKTAPDDEPLPLLTVLELNGLEDALWCFRAVEGFDREKRLLAVAFAREVEHLMLDAAKSALDVAERFANGLATKEELAQARAAAYAAADAAFAAPVAFVAFVAARAAAWAAAAAARAAAVARSAADAAAYAACNAARLEMQEKQTQILRKFLEGTV